MKRFSASLIGLLVVLLVHAVAYAQGQQPVRVEYSSDGICPDGETFTRELLLRTPELRRAEGEEEAPRLSVELRKRGAIAAASEHDAVIFGRMIVKEADGSETEREVAGKSCQEVASALALIASVLITPRPEQRKPVNADGYVLPQPSVEPEPEPAQTWRIRSGLGVGFDNAWAPSPEVGLSFAFEIDSERPNPPQPLIVFHFNYARTPLADATQEWLALRAAVCPMRWPSNRPLYVMLCPFADVGRISGRANVTDSQVPWVAFGAYARIEAEVELFAFSLDGGLVVPLNRHEFVYKREGETGRDVEKIPFVGVVGRLGMSISF